jgi:hypothetical protein
VLLSCIPERTLQAMFPFILNVKYSCEALGFSPSNIKADQQIGKHELLAKLLLDTKESETAEVAPNVPVFTKLNLMDWPT